MKPMETEIKAKLDELFSLPEVFSTYPRMEPIFPGCAESTNYIAALVSMNIKHPDDFLPPQKKGGHRLLELKPNVARKVKRDMINTSKVATDNGAKLVVFSEYSYPSSEDSSLGPRLYDLCKKKNVYIVAGTYHETAGKERGYNKCLIFNPYTEKPFAQIKNDPGRFDGGYEDIRTPDVRSVSIFHTRIGNFVVPICIDVKSGGLENNLLVLNRSDKFFNPVDLVIVPSYTDKPMELLYDCKKLSNKTNTCVLFCNDASYTDQSSVFIHGSKVEPLKDIHMNGSPTIHMYSIDLCDLRKRRRDLFKQIILAVRMT
jgi:predicted amidohydrolase